MSAAFTASAPTLAKLSAQQRPGTRGRARGAAVVVTNAADASSRVHNKVDAVRRGVALGATTTLVSLAQAQPAHAMEGVLSVFNGNPALLGGTCIAVCWGIPQTLGMMVLQKKEAAGRAKCAEWKVDVSDVEEGNWGRIRERVKQEAKRRGEEMPKL